MENVGLFFFSFSLNGGLSNTTRLWLGRLPKGLWWLSTAVFVCVCACLRVGECVSECVRVCVCVCSSRVPGCPSSIGLTLYSIPQGGPGLCASGECQGERERQLGFKCNWCRYAGRKRGRERTQRRRDSFLTSSLVRLDVCPTHRKITLFKKNKVASVYNL